MSILFIFGFRPLPGSFLFHHDRNNYHINYMWVSVPCRGLFYFILYRCYIHRCSRNCFRPLPGAFLFHQHGIYYKEYEDLFPSPDGVFFISSFIKLVGRSKATLFPSPAGVFFISSKCFCQLLTHRFTGFRPLPGSFLFHLMQGEVIKETRGMVSVPCRGLFYFINFWANCWNGDTTSFRPLPGSFLFHPLLNL